MQFPEKNRPTQSELQALISRLFDQVKPRLVDLPNFAESGAFFNKRYRELGVEFKVGTHHIDSAGLGAERLFEVSQLRQTPEIARKMKEAGDRASFSNRIVLAQSGRLLLCYVQYENWRCRDESTGLVAILATALEATEIDLSTFDLTQPVDFSEDSQSVGESIVSSLRSLLGPLD